MVAFIHTKDLVGVGPYCEFDLRAVARPLRKIPETMPVYRLLRLFQRSRRHIALVVDVHETIVGPVTLEAVLEELVGEVQDEFDKEMPGIIPYGPNPYIVMGNTPVGDINDELGVELYSEAVDRLSGLLVEHVDYALSPRQIMELNGIKAEVLEVQGTRVIAVRLTITPKAPSQI